MYIFRALAVLFLAQAVLAQQPTPILPDPKLTPGETFDVTPADICVPGYAKKVRAVPAWLKRQAYAEYGITHCEPGDYEVDHVIPLSLEGSNSIRNLWPQSTKTSPWNSFVKDALERKLHNLVCTGQLDLKTAQREIASNWIDAYRKYRPWPSVTGIMWWNISDKAFAAEPKLVAARIAPRRVFT
jgi:hypothetical protein